ncbi:MAG: caspase family protein [Planctomycetota bacterium]
MHLDGTSYFCPIDARLDRADSLLSLEKLYRLLALSPADVKLMLVDACRNDPRPGGTKDLTAESMKLAESLDKPPQGILVLSSCAPGQVAVEGPDLGHGVFMKNDLLFAVRSGGRLQH